jgi:processive 1,2-diacylglycerol beta-glucosyltransferase
MNRPPRVLILSVAAGYGHMSVSNALSGYLRAHGCDCTVLETVEAINPLLGELQKFGNDVVVKGFPTLYGGIYRSAERRTPPSEDVETPRLLLPAFADRLSDVIDAHPSDVIVCTHIFPAQVVALLKRKNRLSQPVFGIVTDYTIHPRWEETAGLDGYVTASPLLANQFAKKGLDPSRMLPFGIPVDERFTFRSDPAEARRRFELDPDRFTLLLMGGGGGHLAMDRVIRELDCLGPDFQIVAVAGRNRPLLKRLQQLQTRKRLKVFGFTEQVDLLMDAADVAITKPGGVTVSECMAKGLAMILMKPIPGQEERNREFLLNHGLAMSASPTCPLDETLFQLLSDPQQLESMRRSVARFARPFATRDLGDFILTLRPDGW